MKTSIRRRQIFGAVLLFTLISLVMPSYGAADDEPKSPAPVTEIRFRLYNDNLIVIKGSIGPLNGVNLILDTGTTPSAISKELASRRNLRGNVEPLQALNATVQTQSFILPSIQVGPISGSDIRVVVHDLAQLEHNLGISLAGIVGLDVLRAQNFTIDYLKKKIVFGASAPTRNSVHFEGQSPLLTVRATIDGQPVRLILDSGSPGIVVFRNRVATGTLHLIEGPSIDSVGGKARGQSFRADVMLGQEDLGPRKVEIADVGIDSQAGFDGLLGFRAMGFQRVSFDFDNEMFGWESEVNQVSDKAASLLALPVICCGEGFHGKDCQSAIDAIAFSVEQLNARIAGWRVVVVPAARWPILARSLSCQNDLRPHSQT